MVDEVQIPARWGKEAQMAHNDVFPGDLVTVKLSELSRELAGEAIRGLIKQLDNAALAAFRDGKDFMVGPMEQQHPDVVDLMTADITQPQRFEVTVRAGSVEPGSFGPEDVPHGWTLYRVRDWQEGRRK